jgi:flagellum-specific peptidoglycan hydrolase FlgJ
MPLDSPLRAVAGEFFTAGFQREVDGRLLIAISKQETSWGRSGCGLPASHNAFGWKVNGTCVNYSSFTAAIDSITNHIANGCCYFYSG